MGVLELHNELLTEMVQRGIVFGHRKSKTHPKMRPFIGANRNEIDLLDPEATLIHLEKAIAFLREVVQKGGLALLVGTMPQCRGALEAWAKVAHFPYVTDRWLGGTLTNLGVIRGRVRHYEDLQQKEERGELAKYTKHEQQRFRKEITKLRVNFEGLRTLVRLPDVVFIVDTRMHDTAVREARRLGIPIAAIVDSDDDPTEVTHPIIANDHAKSSIEWIIEQVRKGIEASEQKSLGESEDHQTSAL